MNFSKTASYSIIVLSCMAGNPDLKMSADVLHRKLNIPYQYLRQVLTSLSKSGFISGTRGRNGGFMLKKSARKISLSDIVFSVEDSNILDKCIMGYTDCPFNNACPLHDIWQNARENILNVMKNTSLSELTEKTT